MFKQAQDCRNPPTCIRVRATIALALACGLTMFAAGVYLTIKNPRSNAEDQLGWALWFIGSALVAGAASFSFARPINVCIIAVTVAGTTIWTAVIAYWACLLLSGLRLLP